MVDTLGLLLVVLVTAASADDGSIAPEVLGQLTPEHPSRRKWIWSEGKYHNRRLDDWMEPPGVGYLLEVVSRPAGAQGFVLLHRRWVVERTFAWRGRYRRNSRDYEYPTRSSEAMLRISSIHRMLRLLRPNQSKKRVPYKYRELQGTILG